MPQDTSLPLENWPIDKSDIHYDPASQEVTLQREKFDALVRYTQSLLEELEKSEDQRDLAQFRARKAEATANVLQALTEDVTQGTAAVRDWLASPSHSINELSERTGIPYATCHRVINERLGTPDMQIGQLHKILASIAKEPHPSLQPGASRARPRIGISYGPTRRETKILEGVVQGLSNAEIAARLGISKQTVKHQIVSLFSKFKVASRIQLVEAASSLIRRSAQKFPAAYRARDKEGQVD
jgi:ATP/maltotriose-dependent transcriptional regulator MalT